MDARRAFKCIWTFESLAVFFRYENVRLVLWAVLLCGGGLCGWVGGWFVEVCWIGAFVQHLEHCNMHGVHMHSAPMGISLCLPKLAICTEMYSRHHKSSHSILILRSLYNVSIHISNYSVKSLLYLHLVHCFLRFLNVYSGCSLYM